MIIPFDILYEGFCNKLRSAGKVEGVLHVIKKQSNDFFRVRALLAEEPDLVNLLERNINESFECKDELVAQKLWKRGAEGSSLDLLTEALSYTPVPASLEEKVAIAFEDGKWSELIKEFIGTTMKEEAGDESTMSRILYARGCILFSRQRYAFACKDLLRAWLLGLAKTLDLTYRVAACCYECGELDAAKELLQCSAQHLRAMSMSNEQKSVWTMNIVKVLKCIENVRKKAHQPIKSQLCDDAKFHESSEANEEEAAKLFSSESAQLTGTSNVLKLEFSQEQGRHLVAQEDIPTGSTVIAELPFAWALSKVNYHKFCLWCLRRIQCGIPCTSCSSAVFCNASCRLQGMKTFHQKECKVLKLLDSSQKLGNMALLCFRTILITPTSVIEEFASFAQQDTIAHNHLMGLNAEDKLDSSSYQSVFAQIPNSDQRQPGDILKRTFSAIYLTICLKFIGYFHSNPRLEELKLKESEVKPQMSDTEAGIAALVLRHLQGASCNAYGINYVEKKVDMSGDEDSKQLQIDEIGGATYPIISTTNHSCHPNAYRINIPGRMCLVKTLREIRSGEEIYDCYGPLFLTEPRQERMSKLQSQYLFRCHCPPCTDNWPSYGALRKCPTRYKCSSCLCELKIGEKNAHNKVKCPYCDKVTDIKTLLANLTTFRERFNLAKISILAEVFQPFDKDMENILCDYIQACQKAYLDPCIDTVEAQEVLKLFWNLSVRNS